MSRISRFVIALLNNLIWVILISFFLLNVFITPMFFTYRNVINILYHTSILSMLVLGEGIILSTGVLDLSLESTLAFAPGVAIICMTSWIPGLNPFVALFITLVVGALVGWFNGYCVTSLGISSFLQTLSFLILLRGLILFMVPFAIFNLPTAYTFLGSAKVVANIPAAVFVMIFIYVIFQFFFKRTRFGRYFFATGGNPKASYVSGINTRAVITWGFILGGILASIGGILAVGRQSSITNMVGQNMILLAFAGAILGGVSLSGGKGTPMGMLGGALFLGTVNNSLNLLGVNVFLVYAFQGLLIFLALVLDRAKERLYSAIFQRERMKKFQKMNE